LKTVLLIGNYQPFTMMHLLGIRLNPHFQVYYASSQKNKFVRLCHMCLAIIRHRRKSEWIIIDTYSTLNFYYAWACAVLCRLLNIPYIPILRGGNLPSRLISSPQLSRAIFAHAAFIVAPSGYLQKAFEDKGYHPIQIPNFIDINNYHFLQRSTLRPRLLWVRSFDKTYNPEMAIQVLALLSQKYPDTQLCMVGADKDGSLAQCQLLAQKKGVQSNVVFTGRLSKQDWINLSSQYDIFLNTTNFDNTPVSVIEAMALGLPVVSTNVGGLPYLLDHEQDALLSDPNDVPAIVANIQWLIENPAFSVKMAEKARQKVAQFDWEIVQHQWLNLLQ